MEYPSDSGAMRNVMNWGGNAPSPPSFSALDYNPSPDPICPRYIRAPHPPDNPPTRPKPPPNHTNNNYPGHGTKRFRMAPNGEPDLVPVPLRPQSAISGNSVSSMNSMCDHHLKDFHTNTGKRVSSGHTKKRFKVHNFTRGSSIYRVQVITGDRKNAGTDSKVYITINGKDGKLAKRPLTRPIKVGNRKIDRSTKRKRKFRFERGQTAVFRFKDDDIGDVRSIRMENNDVTVAGGWFLEQVIITKTEVRTQKEKTWVFSCQNWLSVHENDGHLTRELYPVPCSKTQYEVVCVTGSSPGAGTDANVFITLFGRSGMSPKTPLPTKSKTNFGPGQSDVFKFKTNCVGRLTKIRIQHDDTGQSPSWFLKRVVVTDLQRPTKWIFHFPCNLWLARDKDDGAICRDLYPVDHAFRTPKKYRVIAYTGTDRDAGTEARVYITLHGEHGSSGEKRLFTRDRVFRPGQEDIFELESLSLGEVKWVRIRHDNSGPRPHWLLEKIIVEELTPARDFDRVYEFPCGQWLADDRGDKRISRDLYAGHDWAVPYDVQVSTGDKKFAGTDAKVYIILNGKKGERSEKIWLGGGSFERNRTDQFNIESAFCIDPLKSITIGHDNSGRAPGWFLNEVVVSCAQAQYEITFPCGKWFSKDEGDRKIERTLYPGKQRKLKEKPWLVRVFTSDVQLAGTDSKVAMVLYGKDKNGETRKSDSVRLESRDKGENFQQGGRTGDGIKRGQRDEFNVRIPDVGVPYKMRIWHEGSGLFPGWHLDKVELEARESKDKAEMFSFPCGRWLAKDEDDHSLIRELPAEGGPITKPEKLIKYKVAVHTGNERFAGTDANVFINIFGEQGDSGERPLEFAITDYKNKFEKGQVDEFELEAVNLKRLRKVRIGHDGKHAGAGWYLEKVVVTPLSGKYRDKDTTFDCNRWLDVKSDDGQIVRELTSNALDLITYQVSVETGNVSGAGTDANVFLKVIGEKGDTGERGLVTAENRKNKFEKGNVDEFKIESDDIGKIQKIRIGHDGANPGSGWYVKEVRIAVSSQGRTYVFSADRWLDTKEADGKLEVELEPSDVLKYTKKVPYNVTVWTGTQRYAGTDANVFIQMYGIDGKTEEFPLRTRSDNFEDGAEEKFKLEGADVGDLFKIRIGHDGAKPGAGWFLDKVLVQRPKQSERKKKGRRGEEDEEDEDEDEKENRRRDGRKKRPGSADTTTSKGRRKKKGDDDEEEVEDYWFHCGKWLAKDEGDKQIIRELPRTDENGTPMEEEVKYRVTVKTGSKWGAGTDANVFIKITGENGDTGERQLEHSLTHKNKFEDKNEDIFEVPAVDLGRLKKINVRHDNSGAGAAWYLDYIEVENPQNGKITKFPCDNWLSRKDGDGEIARVLVPEGKGHDKLRDSTIYNVTVNTGNEKNSGTDANVYIVLCGKDDDTGKILLKETKTKGKRFQQGKSDLFTIDCVDIGELEKIRIGHDNKGWGAGWFLDSVEIEAPTLGKKWTFPCEKWFAKDEHDAKLERELYPSRSDDIEQLVPYEITTFTSDKRSAGTDADVYVVLYGKKGVTRQESLAKTDKERKSRFERGDKDTFRVELEDVGKLEKLRIGHDGSGRGAGWHLDKVEVKRLKGEKMTETYVFQCGKWLASDEDDNQIVRELYPQIVHTEGGKANKEAPPLEGMSISERRGSYASYGTEIEEKTYKVEVITGDVDGAGTDANVFLQMFGEKCETPERQLKKSETYKDKFEKGHTDVFNIKEYDLGVIHSIKIRHDNSMFRPHWFLKMVKVTDPYDDQTYIFRCDDWLATDRGDKTLEKKLFVEGYRELRTSGPSPRSKKRGVDLDDIPEALPYTISVTTGPKNDHGTKAKAWICVNGPRENTGIQQLDREPGEHFEPGSTLNFNLDAQDVGKVKSIELGHDGHSSSSSWYVEEVVVGMPTKDKSYRFPINTWLSRDKGNRKTKQTFTLDSKENITSYQSKIPYGITIYTGQEPEAGTDADVLLTLVGERDTTGEIMLENKADRFKAGGKDTLQMELDNVGPLMRLKVGLMDGVRYKHPDWYLEKIELMNLLTREVSTFPCEMWFSKKRGDRKTSRELQIRDDRPGRFGKQKEYRVMVTTGNKSGAGTTANVYMMLFGDKQESGELSLVPGPQSTTPFQQGKDDLFSVRSTDVGHIQRIRIWHDNSGKNPGWFLDKVQIEDPITQVIYTFRCSNWLSKKEGDRAISRDLESDRLATPRSRDVVVYEVTLTTADDKDAGMVHDAWIKLIGTKADSEILEIPNNQDGERMFKRGEINQAQLRSRYLGKLQRCLVGAVVNPDKPLGEGRKAQWKVLEVAVQETATGSTYTFPCKKWVDIDEEIYEGSAKILEVSGVEDSYSRGDLDDYAKSSEEVNYEICIVTREVMYGSRGSHVYLTLGGTEGATKRLKLTPYDQSSFEANEYNIYDITHEDIGDLQQARIEHDDSSLGAKMFIEKIEVTNQNAAKGKGKFTFLCRDWLESARGGKMARKDLLVK